MLYFCRKFPEIEERIIEMFPEIKEKLLKCSQPGDSNIVEGMGIGIYVTKPTSINSMLK